MASTPPKRIINLLLDLSGTLHIADSPTPKAIDALSKLRNAARILNQNSPGSFRLRFCSNTSKESSADLLSRLHIIGFNDIKQSELFTSLDACAKACHELRLRPLLLLSTSATSSPSFRSLKVSFTPHIDLSSKNKEKKDNIKSPSQLSEDEREQLKRLDSVVIGLEPSLMTYDWLNEAFRILSNEYGNFEQGQKGKLIATHRASYFRPSTDEPLSLGPGPFVQSLENAVGVTATICGKPTRKFFEACLKDMDDEVDHRGDEEVEKRNIIVGDDVHQDLGGGAIELGMERILVRTGKYRAGDEEKATKSVDGIFDSLASFVDSLLQQNEFEKCR